MSRAQMIGGKRVSESRVYVKRPLLGAKEKGQKPAFVPNQSVSVVENGDPKAVAEQSLCQKMCLGSGALTDWTGRTPKSAHTSW